MSDSLAKLATLLSAPHHDGSGSITPPIVQTSLFAFDNVQQFEDRMAGLNERALYTRVQNPTVEAFEALMAQAEGAEAGVGFASGMAAISATLMAFVKPGDRVVCIEHVYPDAYRFMERVLIPFGIKVEYASIQALENDAELLKGAKLAYLESPTSMTFMPLDLPKVAAHAKAHSTLTIIDNSWATPVFQNPIALGIDIVIHSASKYIGGHSDVVAGVVVGSKTHMAAIRDLTLPLLGGKLAPYEAWLLIRGLRTLVARMKQHQASASTIIERLAGNPAVTHLNAPTPHCVAGLRGRSGLFSFGVSDRVDVRKLTDALKHFRMGVSWGGFESLILPTQVTMGQAGPANPMTRFGISPRLVRLSIGLEDVEDLWADLEGGLAASLK